MTSNRDKQLTVTVANNQERNDSSRELIFSRDFQQYDKLCSTSLYCRKSLLSGVCFVPKLASKVKALCKVVTMRTRACDKWLLKEVLSSMSLLKVCIYKSSKLYHYNSTVFHCSLLVADVCLSVGHGKTKKDSKLSACSEAVCEFLKPFLYLKPNSVDAGKMKLVGSEKPLSDDSNEIEVVGRLDVSSDYFKSPVLNVVSSNETDRVDLNRLALHLKQVISVVRIIRHALAGRISCHEKVISRAVTDANLEVRLHVGIIRDGPQMCCMMKIDKVVIAVTEASMEEEVKDMAFIAAVELFCQPCLYIEYSDYESCVRLVGCREPLDDVFAPPQNYSSYHATLSSQCLPVSSKYAQNDSSYRAPLSHHCPPVSSKCPQNDSSYRAPLSHHCLPLSSQCPALNLERPPVPDESETKKRQSLVSVAGTASVMMTDFYHLSSQLKSVLENSTSTTNSIDVLTKALNETKLSYETSISSLIDRHHCHLKITSVLVASSAATTKKDATRKAYSNAAELLCKPYLGLTKCEDDSVMIVGADEPFLDAMNCADHWPQNTSRMCRHTVSTHTVTGSSGVSTQPETDSAVSAHKVTGRAVSIHGVSRSTTGGLKTRKQPVKRHNNVDKSRVVERPHVSDNHCQRTLIITRSQTNLSASWRNLSTLSKQFETYADVSRDVCLKYKKTKSVEDMFEMIVEMTDMCARCEVLNQSNGRLCCQLFINDVLVAVTEGSSKKKAKRKAYSSATQLLQLPYLCLDETLDFVRLLGSDEPFFDMSDNVAELEEEDGYSSCSCMSFTASSQGSTTSDRPEQNVTPCSTAELTGAFNEEDLPRPVTPVADKADIFEGIETLLSNGSNPCSSTASANTPCLPNPVTAVPNKTSELGPASYNNGGITTTTRLSNKADVLKLIEHLKRIVDSVRVMSEAPVKATNAIDMIHRAVAGVRGTKLPVKSHVNSAEGQGFECHVTIGNVYISSGKASSKKRSKHAAFIAAADLLMLPNLRLLDGLELNCKYKLVKYEGLTADNHYDEKESRLGESRATGFDNLNEHAVCDATNERSVSTKNEHVRVETDTNTNLSQFLIVRGRHETESASVVLKESADFNGWKFSYKLNEAKGQVHCSVILDGHVLAESTGPGENSAKKSAAELALQRLTETCYTLQIQQFDVTKKTVTPHEGSSVSAVQRLLDKQSSEKGRQLILSKARRKRLVEQLMKIGDKNYKFQLIPPQR